MSDSGNQTVFRGTLSAELPPCEIVCVPYSSAGDEQRSSRLEMTARSKNSGEQQYRYYEYETTIKWNERPAKVYTLHAGPDGGVIGQGGQRMFEDTEDGYVDP
ncbi:hypothetical protein [Halomicrobium sp. LC1Hm]|nr:hypothetical protein [Halomicrobium sp. LC1Hm]